MIKEIKKIGT